MAQALQRLRDLVEPNGVRNEDGVRLLNAWANDQRANASYAMIAGPSGIEHACSSLVPNKPFISGGHAQCTLSMTVWNNATAAEKQVATAAGFSGTQASRRVLLHNVLAYDALCTANAPLPNPTFAASHIMQPTTIIVEGTVWECVEVTFELDLYNESRKVCAMHRVAMTNIGVGNQCVCLAGQTFQATNGVPGVYEAYAAHIGVVCSHW